MFRALERLEMIRRGEAVFDAAAAVKTCDVRNDAILAIRRERDGEVFLGLFNFSRQRQSAVLEENGAFVGLLSGERIQAQEISLPADGFYWLKAAASGTGR